VELKMRKFDIKETKTTVETITKTFDFDEFTIISKQEGHNAPVLKAIKIQDDKPQVYAIKLLSNEVVHWIKKIGVWGVASGSSSVSRSLGVEEMKKLNALKDSFYDEAITNEEMFKAILNEEHSDLNLVFISSWDNSYYIPKERKEFKTCYFDYIEAGIINRDYDLPKLLAHLKNLAKDEKVYLCTDEIQSIPSYNCDDGRNKFISFYCCIEYVPDVSKYEQQEIVKKDLEIEQFRVARVEAED
jgi:hypothetical protein